MSSLGKTVEALARFREMAKAASPARVHPGMVERTGFGSNPGDLRMLVYAPAGLPAGAPLVVVLHGCGQGAAAYASGAGWLSLADRLGFVVLAPEQDADNNIGRCFNWFEPGDALAGHGEAASIRQMVEIAIADHDLDQTRVFVTGLSAGGGMTSVMLAAYPQVFAAGAVVAGLPFHVADNVNQAFSAMFQPAPRPAHELGALVRDASRYAGPWPRVSIWHGDADPTVQVANAAESVKQWTDVHGLRPADGVEAVVDGARRTVWADREGRPVIESYIVPGLGHGTPLDTHGPEGVGHAGPFLLEAGISSSRRIAEFWGLTDAAEAVVTPLTPSPAPPARRARRAPPTAAEAARDAIAKALAAAGLTKG